MRVSPDALTLGPNAPETLQAQPTLITSIKTHGILQPILVRRHADALEVIAGFKRLAAAREAGLREVPVRISQVDDAAVSALYAASNLQGERRRVPPPTPPDKHAYTPTGMIGGLLDDELNRPSKSTPYFPALIKAGLLLIVLFVAFQLHRCVRRAPPAATEEETYVTANGDDIAQTETEAQPETRTGRPSPARRQIQDWRRELADIEGIEVRDASGTPRIVFQSPVFSRLYSLDPGQTQLLTRVATKIREVSPESLIVIIGHTDNDPVRPGGAFDSNEHLGMLRAKEVEQFLITRAGIPATRVRTTSSGSESPPFPNTPAASKVKNRTVTIEIRSPSRN